MPFWENGIDMNTAPLGTQWRVGRDRLRHGMNERELVATNSMPEETT